MIKNAIPAKFERFETGVYMGPPLEIDTDVPDSIKDAFVVHVVNMEIESAEQLGFGIMPDLPPPIRPLALHVHDVRLILLAGLHFLADAGDQVATRMLEILKKE